jgi:hypothetical protein
VNIDQLMESLSGNAPDPGRVLASVGRKRRAARNRMYAASGGLAVAVVAVVAGVLLHGLGADGGTAAESAPSSSFSGPALAPAAQGAAHSGAASGASAASGAACGTARLQAELAQAVRNGASVIVGHATLTSGAAVQGAGSDAPAYYSLTLRSVRTLAGPTVTSGSVAWIAGASPAAGASASASAGTATAPGTATAQPRAFPAGGELFGVVAPSATPGAPGPVLQAAQVAGGQVVLSGAGCWDVSASGSRHGLATTSGLSGPAQSSADVITKVPLATAEKLAASAGKE